MNEPTNVDMVIALARTGLVIVICAIVAGLLVLAVKRYALLQRFIDFLDLGPQSDLDLD